MRNVFLIAVSMIALVAASASASQKGPIFDGSWFDPQEKGSDRRESNFGFASSLAVRSTIVWHDGSAEEELLPAISTAGRQQVFRTKHLFRHRGTYAVKITLYAADGARTVQKVLIFYDGK